MTRSTVLALATGLIFFLPGGASAQGRQYPLESVEGLRLHNVIAEPAMLQGKKGLRLRLSDDARAGWKACRPVRSSWRSWHRSRASPSRTV